jgi:hypothetical protein
MLGCRRLADSIHGRSAAKTSGVRHITEKLAIPEEHHTNYSIRINDIVKEITLVCLILILPANIEKLPQSALRREVYPEPYVMMFVRST